jgi:hypothetical protein
MGYLSNSHAEKPSSIWRLGQILTLDFEVKATSSVRFVLSPALFVRLEAGLTFVRLRLRSCRKPRIGRKATQVCYCMIVTCSWKLFIKPTSINENEFSINIKAINKHRPTVYKVMYILTILKEDKHTGLTRQGTRLSSSVFV